jgi:hypothetical protein
MSELMKKLKMKTEINTKNYPEVEAEVRVMAEGEIT